MQRGRVVVSLIAALLMVATAAAPSMAATTTPYKANFLQERTVQQTCPPGLPPGSFCFTGSDHSGTGTSSPLVSTATEDFVGFVDFSHPIPNACVPTPQNPSTTGYPDHNAVTITTSSGRLFLTTNGVDCMSTRTDDGTWEIVGGTGIFAGASGSGTVRTQATGGTGSSSDPITSGSTYYGTITLR